MPVLTVARQTGVVPTPTKAPNVGKTRVATFREAATFRQAPPTLTPTARRAFPPLFPKSKLTRRKLSRRNNVAGRLGIRQIVDLFRGQRPSENPRAGDRALEERRPLAVFADIGADAKRLELFVGRVRQFARLFLASDFLAADVKNQRFAVVSPENVVKFPDFDRRRKNLVFPVDTRPKFERLVLAVDFERDAASLGVGEDVRDAVRKRVELEVRGDRSATQLRVIAFVELNFEIIVFAVEDSANERVNGERLLPENFDRFLRFEPVRRRVDPTDFAVGVFDANV